MNNFKVFILTDSHQIRNSTYTKIFGDSCIFVQPSVPTKEWLAKHKFNSTNLHINELYNHYLLWKEIYKLKVPGIILYNNSYTLHYDSVILDLCNHAVSYDTDMFFLGKYLDDCSRYHRVDDINVDSLFNYPVYKTFSPHGSFAYICFPSGAYKLIYTLQNHNLVDYFKYYSGISRSNVVSDIFNKNISNGFINAYTFHPSLIGIKSDNANFECKDIVPKRNFWNWFFFFIILLFIVCIIVIIVILVKHIIKYNGHNMSYNNNSFNYNFDNIIPYGPHV